MKNPSSLEGSRFHGASTATLLMIFAALTGVCALVIFVVVIVQHLSKPPGTLPTFAAIKEKAPAEGEAEQAEEPVEGDEPLGGEARPWGAGTIKGTVTDPGGAPAAGAAVRLYATEPVAGYAGADAAAEGRTGTDGAFVVEAPYPGVFRLEAALGGATAWHEGVSPGAAADLRLIPRARVAATVAGLGGGAAGEEPAVAQLRMVYPHAGRALEGERAGNRFVFSEAPAGAYILSIRAAGSLVEAPVDQAGGGEIPLDLTMPDAVELAGAAKDSFGLPIPGAAIRVFAPATGTFVEEVAAGADGRFSCALPPGRFRIEVEAEGFVSGVVPQAEAGVFQEISLCQGILWKGRVVAEDGAGVRPARVVVEYVMPHLGETRRRELTVAGAGEFEWRSAGAMRERFFAWADGFGAASFENVVPPAPKGGGSACLLPVFVLPRANAELLGRVQDEAGRAVAGARVALAPVALAPGAPGYGEACAVTDRTGRFSMAEVPAAPGWLFVSGAGLGRTAAFVDPRSGAALELVAPAGFDARGIVTGRDGGPLPGAAVAVRTGGREFRVAGNAAGEYLLADLPAGDAAMLRVRGLGGVPAAAGEVMNVRLPEGGRLSARATGESGAAVRFFQARVVLPGEAAESVRAVWVAADEEGRFEITLPARPEVVVLSKPGFDDVRLEGDAIVPVEGRGFRVANGGAIVFAWRGVGSRR